MRVCYLVCTDLNLLLCLLVIVFRSDARVSCKAQPFIDRCNSVGSLVITSKTALVQLTNCQPALVVCERDAGIGTGSMPAPVT